MEKGFKIRMLLFFIIILMFTKCQTSKKVAGFYKSYDKETRTVEGITLNEGGVFEYYNIAGLISSTSKGNWKINADSLFIKSQENYRSGFIEVEISDSSMVRDSISVVIISKEDKLPMVSVITNFDSSSTYRMTDKNGTVKTKKGFHILKILYLDNEFDFISNEGVKNNIRILMSENDLSKRYFDDEKWIRKGNKIITPSGIVFKRQRKMKK